MSTSGRIHFHSLGSPLHSLCSKHAVAIAYRGVEQMNGGDDCKWGHQLVVVRGKEFEELICQVIVFALKSHDCELERVQDFKLQEVQVLQVLLPDCVRSKSYIIHSHTSLMLAHPCNSAANYRRWIHGLGCIWEQHIMVRSSCCCCPSSTSSKSKFFYFFI